MTVYATRAWVGDDDPQDPAPWGTSARETRLPAAGLIVHESRDPQPTGLVDHAGRPIYRLHETVRCGFHRR